MKPEEVWSLRGAIFGTAAGIAIVGLSLMLTIGMAGSGLLGNYERFVMYVVGAPVGSYFFGHVVPRTRLARAAVEVAPLDPSISRMSRRLFLALTMGCIGYAAFVLSLTSPVRF
jgi:hypothetical protein